MFLVFPALAFLLAWAFSLSPALAVGLVLLAASPSASTSTVFTDLARGDTALSLALTAVSKFVPVLTIPVYVSLAARWFADMRTDLSLSFADTSERMVVMVLIPLIIGMALRHRLPDLAVRARPHVLRIALVALVILIVVLVHRERHALPGMLVTAGPAALALCLTGMCWGYVSTALAGYTRRQRTAVTLEMCMQSGGTTIAIAAGLLAVPAMAVPGAVYSLIMYVVAGLFVALRLEWSAGIRCCGGRKEKAEQPLT
jgi:bile acid:Na+ symporter, BASS family